MRRLPYVVCVTSWLRPDRIARVRWLFSAWVLLLAAAPEACTTSVRFFDESEETGQAGAPAMGGRLLMDSVEPSGGTTGSAGASSMGGGSGTGGEGRPVVFELNTDAVCPDDISFTDDLLEVVFDSRDLTMATSQRSNVLSPWSLSAPVAGLAVAGDDTGAEIARDGLSLWWSSRRGINHFDLWFATRPTRTSPWGPATTIDELNSDTLDAFPTVTEDQLFMVFLSVGPGTDLDLYSSTRDSVASPWGPRELLTTVNSSSGEGMPHLSADGLELYFGSDRPGGRGGTDLYLTQRRSRLEEFPAPLALTEFNTDEEEGDPWISSDGSFFVFTRNGDGTDCSLLSVSR